MQIFYRLTHYHNINILSHFTAHAAPLAITVLAVLLVVAAESAIIFPSSSQPSGLLTSYQLVGEPVTIAGLEDNASGLTYRASSNTLFMVVNNPEKILELSLDGKVLRSISLTGFEDTEGIAHIEGQKFAILEERRSAVNFITISRDTRDIKKSDTNSFTLNIFPNSEKNQGLEGISIDHATGDIYLVKEKSPRALYKISGLLDNDSDISISIPWDMEAASSKMDDLSGLFFTPQSRRLLVLSHESFTLSEFGLAGEHFSDMDLRRSNHTLSDTISQAEGVTMTADGSLYIISEPNLLYRFMSKGTIIPNRVAQNSTLPETSNIN